MIASKLKTIHQRIEVATKRAGRKPQDITLVAVSKAHPAQLIREAFAAGQRAFGESYVQELVSKAAELADLDIEWHVIGHLQRNKAKDAAPIATWIHSVDSFELAQTLDRRTERPLSILIEVNIGAEDTKAGVSPDDLPPLAAALAKLQHLKLRGLMCVPPYDPDPERSRHSFRRLRELGRQFHLPELSMGMSHDFEVAIEEGATIVRVGTAIFGERT